MLVLFQRNTAGRPALTRDMLCGVLRLNAIQVLVIAAAIAALPILHNHPAIPGGDHAELSTSLNLPCAVCAATRARVTLQVPRLAAPLPATEGFLLAGEVERGVDAVRPLASRAPPVR